MRVSRLEDAEHVFFAALGDRAPAPPRSTGLHLTDVTRHLLVGLGHLTEPEGEPLPGEEALKQLRFTSGYVWERVMELGTLSLFGIERPGEVELDGIAGSPDYLEVQPDGAVIVHETKWTWKSARGFDLDEPKWIGWKWQLLSYQYMVWKAMHLPAPPIAKLHVMFACGDYAPPSRPQLGAYLVQTDASELDAHWHMIRNAADSLKERG